MQYENGDKRLIRKPVWVLETWVACRCPNCDDGGHWQQTGYPYWFDDKEEASRVIQEKYYIEEDVQI